MTQEEKAKAYDEAVKRAKAAIDMAADKDLVGGVVRTIFPELAESEDERIRKELKEAFEAYDIESKWNGIPIRSIFAWLEKQKENPKSADSIPSDCTSDAKCEDRWHKVADSMPDNPREVLCKDEAGNYFIGRYYTGEGWEISNYDDEDKPHHLNPPVSKWIDFPSEKQKEQKPEWSEEDVDMLNSCISSIEEAKENRYAYKETDGDTSYDHEIAWLKALRPSWKPSEEQMKALEAATVRYQSTGLESLFEELKKL